MALLIQYLSTAPSATSNPLLGKVWTLCASFGKVGPGIQPWREYGVVTAFPPSAPLVPSHTDCRVTAEAATPLFEAGAWFLPPPSSPPTLFQVVKLFHCYTKSLLAHLHHTYRGATTKTRGRTGVAYSLKLVSRFCPSVWKNLRKKTRWFGVKISHQNCFNCLNSENVVSEGNF